MIADWGSNIALKQKKIKNRNKKQTISSLISFKIWENMGKFWPKHVCKVKKKRMQGNDLRSDFSKQDSAECT